ncbi:MAG TPA: carboxylesterase/lipase family protein [Pseudomonadales bacterium]|nr:carboxylesterase/lipase family protein [Pseudomonadales bacterium]
MPGKNRVRSVLLGLQVILAAVLLAACSPKQDGPVVRIANGDVQGFLKEDVHLFYGIPYAQAPVGDLRWKAPRPFTANWSTVRAATEHGPHCFQYMLYMQRGVEDCLYLNVATPDVQPAKPKPVMVWFHGGGFIGGDSLEGTPLQRLSKHGDVVVVSMNYRVGALGFLAHPALSVEGQNKFETYSSGNYGLMDQQAALHWVHDNIAAFGGDPGNVTIFGESAGGMSVCAHLASPLSAGLFKQAIVESGPCASHNPSLHAAEKQGELMAIKLGCEGRGDLLACMRSKKPQDVLDALPNDPAFVFGEGQYGVWGMPVVDGRVLTDTISNSFASGKFNRVPVINGSNADEGSLLVMFSHEYRFKPLQAGDYEKRIRYLIGDNAEAMAKIKTRYPLEKYADPGAALAELFGDSFMACSVEKTSDLLSPWTPVYGYSFNYPHASFILPERRKLNAFHGAELQFVFGMPMAWFQRHFSGDEQHLSEAMMDYWSQFARTGNPNSPDNKQMAWPVYKTDTRTEMLFDRAISVAESPKHEACEFWRGLNLPPRNGLAHFEH